MPKTLPRSAALAFLCISAVSVTGVSRADEKVEKPSYWLSRGYFPASGAEKGIGAQAFESGQETPPWAPHSLAWPVSFQDAQHSIGNSMAEFQSYGDGPYYHGGCDLRVAAGAEVRTPIAGRIEAGHYGYTNLADGSMEKYWTPWPKSGDPTYFEVAVITDDGYRFEFHHMNENRLSPEVLKILQGGQGGKVAAGAWLGNTIVWPDGVYHHTHYNIHTPSGVSLNPEYYSPLLDDHVKPQVSTVLAVFKNGRTEGFGSGRFTEVPDFFALAVIDHLDGDVYDHPPTYAGIQFENGRSFAWDFRERLAGPDGKFPSIWSFFVESIESPDGQTLATEGGYGEGVSVVRVPVPVGAQGKFTIQIADEAGNSSQFQGAVGP